MCVCARSPAPNAPPTDLVVFNETTTSMNARWNPAQGRVQNYRITYVPTSGGRSQTVSRTTGYHTIPTMHHVFILLCVAIVFHKINTKHVAFIYKVTLSLMQGIPEYPKAD